MKLSPGEQEQIVSLLTRIYLDIREIEAEYQLLAGEGDIRPRIEHFHDAVRALSSQDAGAREPGERLSIELLAYDLSCLRYIQSRPLSPFKPHGQNLSPSTDLLVPDKNLTVQSKRPDRATRERIIELYQHYAVLFAALLKPLADNDFLERSDDLNHDMQDMAVLIQKLEAFAEGKGTLEDITASIHHLEDAGLRQDMLAFLHEQDAKRKDKIKKKIQYLKEQKARKDKELAAIDAAHLNYAMGQLAVYEEAADMLKTLAQRGMNLVGKFVEASVAATRREMGR